MPTILAVSPIAQTHARLQPVPTQRQVPQPRPCALSSCIPRTRTPRTPARPRVACTPSARTAAPGTRKDATDRSRASSAQPSHKHDQRCGGGCGGVAGARVGEGRCFVVGARGDRARERARAGVWTGERGSCSWAHRTSRRVLSYIIRASHITSRRQHGGRPRRVQESARR